MALTFRHTCGTCNGTGQMQSGMGTIGCISCSGTGLLYWGQAEELEVTLKDMADKVNDVLDKCNDLKEKCDEILVKLA